METFEKDFNDNLAFISQHKDLINSHLVDFITENLWEKSLPTNLRVELEKFAENSTFPELLHNSPELKKIIECTESLSLKNNAKVLSLQNLLNEFSKNEEKYEELTKSDTNVSFDEQENNNKKCEQNVPLENESKSKSNEKQQKKDEFKQNSCFINSPKNDKSEQNLFFKEPKNDFMKDKKSYEISVLSRVVGALAETKNCLIIDAGGGKGYLGTHLSQNYSIPVLSIDSNPNRHQSAINRQKLMEKKGNQSLNLAQHTVQFIDDETNYVDLVRLHFPAWKGENYLLTGLHTCGPLAHAMIKAFQRSPALKILCVVSCCYHLTDDLLTTKFDVSKTMRMLAQQSVERIGRNDGELPVSLFYRALLQVLLQSLGLPDAKVGRGAPTDDFPTYAEWALKKIGVDAEKIPSKLDLQTLETSYLSYKWKLNTFQTLRAHLGTVVESAITLDRFIHLQRSGKCTKLFITRVFDPLLSPRCYAIIALK